jgi:hypothetical protein
MHSLKVEASNGFVKKQTAPAAMARVRVASSGNAVIKMIGMRRPCALNRRCNSRPSTRGICTSVTRHCVSSNCGDCRNSSQDANVRARQPRDRTSLSVATLAEASSSTIEMISKLDNSQTRPRLMRYSRNHRNRAVFPHKMAGRDRSCNHT